MNTQTSLSEILADKGYRLLIWKDTDIPCQYNVQPFHFPVNLKGWIVYGEGRTIELAFQDLERFLLIRDYEVPETQARHEELDAQVEDIEKLKPLINYHQLVHMSREAQITNIEQVMPTLPIRYRHMAPDWLTTFKDNPNQKICGMTTGRLMLKMQFGDAH